jgi:hypothetical protein
LAPFETSVEEFQCFPVPDHQHVDIEIDVKRLDVEARIIIELIMPSCSGGDFILIRTNLTCFEKAVLTDFDGV